MFGFETVDVVSSVDVFVFVRLRGGEVYPLFTCSNDLEVNVTVLAGKSLKSDSPISLAALLDDKLFGLIGTSNVLNR